MTEKKCTKCDLIKDISEFSHAIGYRNGINSRCKECIRINSWNRRRTHPENKEIKAIARKRNYLAKREEELAYGRAYRAENPIAMQARYRKTNLAKYGITAEQYQSMEAAQNFGCAICGNKNVAGRRLSVDHDHLTNKVRGLLCGYCNSAIGMLKDSPDLALKAAEYLSKHVSILEVA